ncbi:hypothetical protein [Mycobacterium sp.]|uniref:hypothetical protein n=1 Tax=Mycobacterium sp. TaxID=1785 RepID=UPI003F9DDFB4
MIEHQQKAIVSIDLRLLDWGLTDHPDEIAADRAALEAEARADPQQSVLLAKLLDGMPVVVEWSALHLPADPPEWLSDPRITPHVRVRADDLVEPTDEPPDQCAYMMG